MLSVVAVSVLSVVLFCVVFLCVFLVKPKIISHSVDNKVWTILFKKVNWIKI